MAILLVQLADMHFRQAGEPPVSRAESIGAAIVAEAAESISTVVLALCGDVAYSGLAEQFRVGATFLEKIESSIRDRHPGLHIVRVVTPGNHDCDFTGDQTARELMVSSVAQCEVPAPSIEEIILHPLKAYFAFSEALTGAANAITASHPFYHAVDLQEDQYTLRIHLLNTAWMSSRTEKPGSLYFPLDAIQPPSSHAQCSIAILHHPIHWFSQPSAMRPLRDRIAQIASVVLVNHEHVAGAFEQNEFLAPDSVASRTLYVLGGVIQETGAALPCTFNALRIDMKLATLDFTRLEYREGPPAPFFERTAAKTISFALSPVAAGAAGFAISRDMMDYLRDPGAPIAHPRRDPRSPIQLSDIFLYPDLWELDADHKGSDQKCDP
jgi:hypothetical protein